MVGAPRPLDAAFFLVGVVLIAVTAIATLLSGVFAVIAAVEAIFGTPWEYPLARNFSGCNPGGVGSDRRGQ